MQINNSNKVNFTARFLAPSIKAELGEDFYKMLAKEAKKIGDKKDLIVMSDVVKPRFVGQDCSREVKFDYYTNSAVFPDESRVVTEHVKGPSAKASNHFLGISENLTIDGFKNKILQALLSFSN